MRSTGQILVNLKNVFFMILGSLLCTRCRHRSMKSSNIGVAFQCSGNERKNRWTRLHWQWIPFQWGHTSLITALVPRLHQWFMTPSQINASRPDTLRGGNHCHLPRYNYMAADINVIRLARRCPTTLSTGQVRSKRDCIIAHKWYKLFADLTRYKLTKSITVMA